MATWFAQNSSVNIDSANQWNAAADGSGAWLTWASLGATDLLVANGKTAIAINVDFTCSKISTAANGGTAGGGFTAATSGVTITSDIEGGTTICVTCALTSGNTLTTVGNITAQAASGLTLSSTGTWNHTGNVTGSASNNGITGASIGGASTINFVGNITGGTGTGRHGMSGPGGGASTINLTGTISGGSATNAAGLSGNFNVNGGNLVFSTGVPLQAGTYKWTPGAGSYMQIPFVASGTLKLYPSGGLLSSRLVGI